jgi:hypothetical protein
MGWRFGGGFWSGWGNDEQVFQCFEFLKRDFLIADPMFCSAGWDHILRIVSILFFVNASSSTTMFKSRRSLDNVNKGSKKVFCRDS